MTEVTRAAAGWWRFQLLVESLGGTVLESNWLGGNARHRVRCAEGHQCQPRPGNVQQGQGVCPKCARNDPGSAENAFRARVGKLNGVVLEPVWLGNKLPHRVRCAQGHDCSPRPADVQQGQGFCPKCAGHDHDTFYVVSGVDRATGLPTVKPGITSRDGRARMGNHAADGLRTQHGVWTGLPEGAAHRVERSLLSHLAAEGWTPTRGLEYFPIAALPPVLTFLAEWL